MAERKPLVLINGRPSVLPDGDLPSGGLPPGGTVGQVVTKTGPADGVVGWADPVGGGSNPLMGWFV